MGGGFDLKVVVMGASEASLWVPVRVRVGWVPACLTNSNETHKLKPCFELGSSI